MKMKKPGAWWDETLSPISGCTPAGAGCGHCHSIVRMKRHLPMLRGKGNALVSPHTILLHPERWEKPRHWKQPRVILTPMLGDYFHEQAPREAALALVGCAADCPQHTFVVLTKRYARAAEFFTDCPPPPNVIAMGSVWDQESADSACESLSRLRGVRWGLHCEPLLGPIDLADAGALDLTTSTTIPPHVPIAALFPGSTAKRLACWIVSGGENGPGARPSHPDWHRQLRDQCGTAGVPFWFKGYGSSRENAADRISVHSRDEKHHLIDLNSRHLDGRTHDEVPW